MRILEAYLELQGPVQIARAARMPPSFTNPRPSLIKGSSINWYWASANGVVKQTDAAKRTAQIASGCTPLATASVTGALNNF